MPVISVELTIFVLVLFFRIGIDFFKPFDEFLMLYLCEHLGDGTIARGQYQLRAAMGALSGATKIMLEL